MDSCFLLFVALLNSIVFTNGHKDGAPLKACLTMVPGHGDNVAQKLDSAVHKIDFASAQSLTTLTTNANNQLMNNMYVVTITALKDQTAASAAFKGFFLQARSTTSGDANPVGTWDMSGAAGLAKGVDCGNHKNSAVTHVDNSLKPSITLLWNPPAHAKGKVVFVATLVQEFKTFWVGIQSEVLTLGSSGLTSGLNDDLTTSGGFTTSGINFETSGNSSFGINSTSETTTNLMGMSTTIAPLNSNNNNNNDRKMSPMGNALVHATNKSNSTNLKSGKEQIKITLPLLLISFLVILF